LNKEILNTDQVALLPLVKEFKRSYYLVGGTAIALQIGHRRSIDFDLFKSTPINHKQILSKISPLNARPIITRRVDDQLNLILHGVKFTFFEYPFKVPATIKFEDVLKMPKLLDLAAMKAYALGRRSKWKDYVDLFFILSNHFTIKEISERSKEIFGDLFSEKQFRAQLCYFVDVDYEEKVDFLVKAPSEKEIKKLLSKMAVEF
jgi:hypothetical protein